MRCHPHPMLLFFVVHAELNLGYAKPLCVVSWVVPLLYIYFYVNNVPCESQMESSCDVSKYHTVGHELLFP